MERPENYPELQRKWCVGRSAGVEEGARSRVKLAVDNAKKENLSFDKVLVLGPQHGFELLEFKDQGATEILGIDCVPSFCEDCRALGFECIEGDIERLTAMVTGQWNIYASHILEHCYDPQAAIREINAVCDQWCFVGVPIEPTGGSAGHCNPIRSHEHLASFFPEPTWRKIYYNFRPSSRADRYGVVEAMYSRE